MATAEDMFNKLDSSDNRWALIQNADLCGSESPCGIIFTLMLTSLARMAPTKKLLSLVKKLQAQNKEDLGLDRKLLELEKILAR